ncbi:HD-GYP domain-containing protein [Candidatus Latescibacterota bacterium]
MVSMLRKTNEELNEAYLDTIHRLALTAEFKDFNTGVHIMRIREYSALIAQKMGLPEDEVQLIYFASPMHDIGKIGIPDKILLKRSKLSPEGFSVIKMHTVFGAKILEDSKSSILRAAHTIAEAHHEWWDGSGYPHGFGEEEIPLSGRIVSLADVFDALTSRRPYKDAYSSDVSFEIIAEGRDSQFDPDVVDVFLDNAEEVEHIFMKHRESA